MTMTQTDLTSRLLAMSRADQTEVLIAERDRQLTRFANSEIHQNVAEVDTEVHVRVVVGDRVGMASTNDLSDGSLARVLERAALLARHAVPDAGFPGLPQAQDVPRVDYAHVAATAETTPEARALVAEVLCRMASEAGLRAFGAFETSTGRLTIANSHGLYASQLATKADVNLVMMGDDSSGYASYTGADVTRLDAEGLGRTAIEKALASRHPVELAPGAYTVMLEEDAVADLVEYVASAGFGGKDYNDGISFLAGHLGEQLVGANVTLHDDPLAPDMLCAAFDFEGVPKRRLTLIDRGVARAVTHDSHSARKAGTVSTGHARPAPGTEGPIPTHLRMEGGTQTKAELLRGIERGILVTRFHYTNLAEARTATLTGMTRDGTFWVEHGEIVRPLRNMRFTSSALEALRMVRGLSSESKLVAGYHGSTRVPALVVDGFRFSGVTRF